MKEKAAKNRWKVYARDGCDLNEESNEEVKGKTWTQSDADGRWPALVSGGPWHTLSW